MGKINERCGGIDVGKRFLLCCALSGAAHEEPRSETRRFDTTVADLVRLRDWLAAERITHVVMESTGSYWVPVFNILEDHFTIVLANPEEVKNRKGHKTDRKDAEHLADLLRHDHVRASYIPPKPVRDLRDLTRRRLQLIQDGTRERNRVEKLLEHVNVKIGNVLSDVFGVSGQSMLLALLEGKAAAEEIAQLARGQAKRKVPQLTEALEGHGMRDHERFIIRSCLRHLACLKEEVEQVDCEILQRMQEPPFARAFLLLQTIPGVGQLAAASILAETGVDLATFPTAEKMASWAGLCPGNRESAGIQKGSQTTQGNSYLRTTLVQCAWAPYAAITRGMAVNVEPAYLEARSSPGSSRYFWAYRVTIENQGRETVQLLSRHWMITNARGELTEVKGPGVVGEQPVLRPGESYEYTSGAPLNTPSWMMGGAYLMESENGERFYIEIPTFSLDRPNQGVLLNKGQGSGTWVCANWHWCTFALQLNQNDLQGISALCSGKGLAVIFASRYPRRTSC